MKRTPKIPSQNSEPSTSKRSLRIHGTIARQLGIAILSGRYALRDLVEPAAAALAAGRRTQVQLATLRQALKDMQVHTLATDAGQNADLTFHSTLLQATQNPFLISLATSVGAAIRITTVFKQRNQPLRRNPIPDHERVYEAIASKNPARARSAMRALIRLARIDTSAGTKRRKEPASLRRKSSTLRVSVPT